jgi:hypothetical protein
MWHWYRVFSEFCGLFLSVSFHHASPYITVIWGMNKRFVGGRSSETESRPIDMNSNNNNNI